MTLYTKDEEGILEQNILFHKAQGIDAFLATDCSSDKSVQIYETYKKKGWVLEVLKETQKGSQSFWVDKMIKIAKEKYGAHWVINSDADEFWYCKNGSLKEELAKIKTNKIFAKLYCMLDENKGSFLFNIKKVIKSFPPNIEKKLITQNKLSKFSQLAKQFPKVICRTQDYIKIHEGNHDADMLSNWTRDVSKNISILHYNIRGLEHFKHRIFRGYQNRELALEQGQMQNVGVHTKYFYEGAMAGKLILDEEYHKAIGKLCQEEIKQYGLVENDLTLKNFFDRK
jgi:hypothetical protein